MKRKKISLYSPYLNIMGGGELHILSIMKILGELGHTIEIFWDTDLSLQIKERFNLTIPNCRFVPNIFKDRSHYLKKCFLLASYDAFFYVPDGSYFFSPAKKNYIFAMVPKRNLYPTSFLNKLKTNNYRFITNSEFTCEWLLKWNIKSSVIFPYVNDIYLKKEPLLLKKKLILSVGRFFPHLHSKQQDIVIKTFKKLKQKNSMFNNFELIIAGGLKKEDNSYFQSLHKEIGSDSTIHLKANISFSELVSYYKTSMFYWHFTGYGIDDAKSPELVEHMGITPLEAMASETIPFCYRAGGPRKIITDGINGFLFSNEEELFNKMRNVYANPSLYQTIMQNGREFVQGKFSYPAFKNNVVQIIDL